MQDPSNWSREGQLWIGFLTVASWFLFVGGSILVREVRSTSRAMGIAIEDMLDPDYLLSFREGTDPGSR